MINLKDYLFEAYQLGEIRNTKLRKLLDSVNLQDIHLMKGRGYFYIISDKYIFKDTDIYVNSFNQQTPETWFTDIIELLKQDENREIVSKEYADNIMKISYNNLQKG